MNCLIWFLNYLNNSWINHFFYWVSSFQWTIWSDHQRLICSSSIQVAWTYFMALFWWSCGVLWWSCGVQSFLEINRFSHYELLLYETRSAMSLHKILIFALHRRKKILHVWNNMRVCKWWQKYHFWYWSFKCQSSKVHCLFYPLHRVLIILHWSKLFLWLTLEWDGIRVLVFL